MRVLSLFAGIGGFDLGLERAGITVVGQVEIDPFCQRVLAARWPGVERAPDVRKVGANGREWNRDLGGLPGLGHVGHCDLLVGGFPCQDLSVAGKRTGLGGERSGLFWEIVRIAKEVKPTWGIFENVPGLLSSHRGRDMALVVKGLRECWPVVGWRILDSRYFGVAQRRRRVFFVCGPTEAGVAQVLALTEGGAGDLAPGREAGAHVAHAVSAGAGGSKFGSGRDGQDDFVVTSILAKANGSWRMGADEVAGGMLVADPLTAGSNPNSNMAGRRREDDVNLVATALPSDHNIGARRDQDSLLVAHALTGEGHDASEDGTGRGTPIIAVRASGSGGSNGLGVYQHGDAPTIDTSGDVAIVFTERTRADGRAVESQAELAYSLNNPGRGGRTQENRVALPSAVRRLTPVECEKLQAFPPGWTCLCQPLDAYAVDADEAALRCRCPDSPRYRALGNAVTVNVIEWISSRLKTVAQEASA